jgi:hypothetical protein
MACRPLNYEEGKVILVPATSGVAFTKGCMTKYTSGLLVLATADQNTDVTLVSATAVTTTATGQLIPCWPTMNVLFEVDCEVAWLTAEQGTYCDLAGETSLDTSSVTDELFFIIKGIGTTAVDTKVIGYFTQAAPNAA